jgi:DNA-binding MarR family transcriptional regulator
VTPNATTQIVGGLFRSRNYVWDNDQRIVTTFGISWSQFLILRALRFEGGDFTLSPTELYDAAQASSSGMTKMLHGLTDAGYVERIANPTDRRSTLVCLTSSGADIVETIIDKLIETNTELFEGLLTDKDCNELAKLLSRLSEGLQRKKSLGR